MNEEILKTLDTVPSDWDELANVDPAELAIERMREKIVDMTEAPEGFLKEDFKSKHYAFHSAKNEKIEKIIESGYLGNALAVYGKVGDNSGYEGISWSIDGIDAMPGTDGHIAGFLAAPENVLGDATKMVVPSRPAPYEMLQIGSDMETEKFYEHRIQFELFSGFIFMGEANSVKGNFIQAAMWNNERQKENPNSFVKKPMLYDFANDERCNEDFLRQLYEIDEAEQVTKMSKELFQQWDIPVGAVWIQRVIDGGLFDRSEYQKYKGMDVKDMIKAVEDGNDELRKILIGSSAGAGKHYDESVDADLEKASAIKIPIEQMYFVTNSDDLDGWIKKFAESGNEPRGFLLYDGAKVKKSNFASSEKGDNEELSAEISHVVGSSKEFWSNDMEFDVSNTPRSGSKGQVIKETFVKRNKILRLVDNELTIVEE